jgi:transcription elongation factor GreA
MDENLMTAEGLQALEAEIERLEGPERYAMAQQIKAARELGDLKENAEYHTAKEEQAQLETRIAQLRERLSKAKVVEVTGGDTVGFGSTVEVEDEQSGKRATYTLVAALEASPGDGRISAESPVATALMGLKPGQVATVATPGGERRFKIVAVS